MAKKLIFTQVKLELFNEILEVTTYYAPLSDDDLAPPIGMPTLIIDRGKAASERDPTDKWGRSSMFMQAVTHIGDDDDDAKLRQAYVGKLDAGQKRSFLVQLTGEGVSDNGGPYRELFSDIASELQSDALTLLCKTPNNQEGIGSNQGCYITNPARCGLLDKSLYLFIGLLMGVGVRTEVTMPLCLPSLFWKYFIDVPTTTKDLKQINLRFMKFLDEIECCLEEEWTSKFPELYFTSNQDQTGLELIPNGRNIRVTFETRNHYIQKAVDYQLKQYHEQIEAIKKGFSRIIPIDYLKIFTWKELEKLICGDSDFDIEDLMNHTIYEGVNPGEPHIQYFWEVMKQLDVEQKKQFLQFSWARSRFPVNGRTEARNFKLQGPPPSSHEQPDLYLPASHTCFFSVNLPRYSSVEITREKLLYAITHCKDMDNDFRLH
eukprot:TRINITY_DN6856_c0_g1_i4.p1 TRINITY_DN6856_c0_g1~~TRINITY_DN6856_c0_g1_i4.p1  ORF type:complete len:432 (-),score=84.58 TRINITY_DN6856_c0_g1_i4:52-1347(-)